MYKAELRNLQLGKKSLTFNVFSLFPERYIVCEKAGPTAKLVGKCQKRVKL